MLCYKHTDCSEKVKKLVRKEERKAKQRVENVKEIEATVAAIREETSRQRLEKLSRKYYTMWKVICTHLFEYTKAWTCQAYLIFNKRATGLVGCIYFSFDTIYS